MAGMAPLSLTPRKFGRGSKWNLDEYDAACYAVSNKGLCLQPSLCLLPAHLKLWQANVLAYQSADTLQASQFSTLISHLNIMMLPPETFQVLSSPNWARMKHTCNPKSFSP